MTREFRAFRPEELDGADDPVRDADIAEAHAAARELEGSLTGDAVHVPASFTDRVMAAVHASPAPVRPGILAPLVAAPGLGGLISSLRGAWGLVISGSGRSVGLRATGLAYILVVLLAATSLTSFAAIGAAGAIQYLTGGQSPAPSVMEPTKSPLPTGTVEPSGSPEPSESMEPSNSAEPGESLKPSESPAAPTTGTPSPRPTPEHSDEHPSSSPDASDDHGGSGSPTESPKPSETPGS
ncbi:MAG: hypothetical protein ABI598_05575 [Chloroflexota bacterium]